jgi:DNA-directed RNA polymerase subunit RPC12/RpoP
LSKYYYLGNWSPSSEAISMRCPECSSVIGGGAYKCPRCGYVMDIAHEQLARSHHAHLLTGSLLLMLLVFSLLALAFMA